MALVRSKNDRVPPATARLHYWEIGLAAWAPVLALLALTLVAGLILYLKVAGL